MDTVATEGMVTASGRVRWFAWTCWRTAIRSSHPEWMNSSHRDDDVDASDSAHEVPLNTTRSPSDAASVRENDGAQRTRRLRSPQSRSCLPWHLERSDKSTKARATPVTAVRPIATGCCLSPEGGRPADGIADHRKPRALRSSMAGRPIRTEFVTGPALRVAGPSARPVGGDPPGSNWATLARAPASITQGLAPLPHSPCPRSVLAIEPT